MNSTTKSTSNSRAFHLTLAAVMGSVMVGCGASSGESDDIAYARRYGLEIDSSFRPTALRAITASNHILAAREDKAALRPGWLSPAGATTDSSIPVLLLEPTGLSQTEIVRLTDRCEAVLVQGAALERWLALYQSPDSLTADPASVLTLLLLHEVGHHEHRDCGQNALGAADSPFNLDKNADKAQEVAADKYAAQSLLKAERSDWSAKEPALNTEMAVTTLSFLVSGTRIVTHPGSSVLPTPQLFWDSSLTHPNMEWRLLSMSYQLHPSAEAKALLEEFETARDKATEVIFDSGQH